MRIEAGTWHIEGNTWGYRYGDAEGDHVIVFTAEPGVKPRIGDSIEAGVHVPLVGYIINGDVSKWENKWEDEGTYYGRD